jgi:hypothetical protein
VVRTRDSARLPETPDARQRDETTGLGEPQLPNPVREAWVLGTAVLAMASGAAQLVVSGNGRIALAAIFLATVAFLGVRLWQLYPRQWVSVLQKDLAEKEHEILRYRAAVERIVDRQFPLFEERVEITVSIGGTAHEDVVTERHWTTPKPYLVYLLIRPITPVNGQVVPSFEDLRLTCEVDGDDMSLSVLPVSETVHGVLLLILFQPGLRDETAWSLRYSALGLWDPLRENGYDHLGWTPSTLDGREPATTIKRLTLHVVFPAGARGTGLWERHDLGFQVIDSLPTGQRRITWTDDAPTAARYDWELVMSLER